LKPHILCNPASSKGRSKVNVIDWSREYLHDIVDLTRGSAEASAQALRQAVAEKRVSSLLVAGGDGLIHLAIQTLAQTDIPLAILPMGSGNDFALALGIDNTLHKELFLAEPCPVDLLKITPSTGDICWVASIAIAGFPASINARANSMTLPLGSQIYTLAALLELPKFSRTEVQVVVDGKSIALDTAMLAIGNTCFFGGGMLACPDASHNDGLLHLTSIEGVGRLTLLLHLKGRFGGTAGRREVLRLSGQKLKVLTGGIDFRGDGEFVARSPLQIVVVPGALKVRGVAR